MPIWGGWYDPIPLQEAPVLGSINRIMINIKYIQKWNAILVSRVI